MSALVILVAIHHPQALPFTPEVIAFFDTIYARGLTGRKTAKSHHQPCTCNHKILFGCLNNQAAGHGPLVLLSGFGPAQRKIMTKMEFVIAQLNYLFWVYPVQ